jgi:hypothetical protein
MKLLQDDLGNLRRRCGGFTLYDLGTSLREEGWDSWTYDVKPPINGEHGFNTE